MSTCRLGFWGLGHKLPPRGHLAALHSRKNLRKGSGTSQASLFPAAKPLRWNAPGLAPSLQQPEKAAPTLGPQLWAPVGGASSHLAGQQGALPGAWGPLDEERALLSPDHPTFQSPPEPLPPTNASPPLPPLLPALGAKIKAAQGRRGGAALERPFPRAGGGSVGGPGSAFLSSWAASRPRGLGGTCLPEAFYLGLGLG